MNVTTIKSCRDERSLPCSKECHYLHRTMRLTAAVLALVSASVACSSAPPRPAPEPVRPLEAQLLKGPLPPVPAVTGPLALKVVYPRPDQAITSKDSNFVLGSVGNGTASLSINGAPAKVWPNGAFLAFVANPRPETPYYDFVAAVGPDTARLQQRVRVPGMLPLDTVKPPPNVVTDTTPTWVVLGLADSLYILPDTDRVVIGRPGPNTVYRWFLLPGTRVQLTARYPGFARVRLDSALQIWVEAPDATRFATDTIAPRRIAGNSRVRSDTGWADLIIPIAERPAFFVEERDRSLELTLYDTRGSTDLVNYPTTDSLIKYVEWAQERSDRVRYTIRLSGDPYGYLVLYQNGALVLRVRRPPPVIPSPAPVIPSAARNLQFGAGSARNLQSALSGLTIAVDPGHPPAGATGPTGLYEADGVLPVGLALERILKERGARVVMTRTTRDPVDLTMRAVIARRAGAHAVVSLHYNAYGDGVNPLTQPNGMEVYFYRPHSEPLARALQNGMLHYLPLDDQGVYYRSLAVVRTPWMPAALVEGGFIIIPEQESAMRTQWYQERYARAVADGLEAFFRGLR